MKSLRNCASFAPLSFFCFFQQGNLLSGQAVALEFDPWWEYIVAKFGQLVAFENNCGEVRTPDKGIIIYQFN